MELRKHTLWKTSAGERIGNRENTLTLIHTAIVVGAQVVLALLSLLLNKGIENTGGLSGMGARAALSTAQTFLQYAVMILLPFWEIGYLRATLGFARGQRVEVGTFTFGLRRFGPALRLTLLKTVLAVMLMVAAINVGSVVFTATPWAAAAEQMLAPIVQAETVEDMQALMDALPQEEMLRAITPALIIAGILFVAAYIPLFYRIRMAEYAVVEDEKVGAFAALRKSLKITRGNAMSLFRLDLSFWWFYALQILITALGFGDLLLLELGTSANANLLYIVFLALQGAAQLLLYWKYRAKVQTAYALAYDEMQQGEA